MGRDSSVGIATRYGLDGPEIKSRWGARFSAPVQTGPGGPPSLLYNGYRVLPGGKVRPGRGVDHPPPLHLAPRLKEEYSHAHTPPLGLPGLFFDRRYDIYLLTATGLSLGGSSTVHIYTQTIHRTTQITTNLEEYGPCPVFASFTLAFALQPRKKHEKTSVRVRKTSVRVRKTSVWDELF